MSLSTGALREDCGKTGHRAKECKNPEEKAKAQLAQVDNDEPTLLMATLCVLHDVELEPEANESHKVHLKRVGGRGAEVECGLRRSNRMTGFREVFFELNGGVTGR